MGIQGLIPFLDKSSSRINIAEFKGSCVAVDAYCWLHKGVYTCAEKLAKGEKCDAYVFYCMKYVNMLLSHDIKPILVFDGRHLPAKADIEKKRRESREVNRKTAAELLKVGRADEARNYLRRCVDVSHTMALALIKECRKINVDCIVAPYEADAQLAYLNLQNIAQIVITEDSDLVLFGCSKIIFKMDLQGYGLLVERNRLYLSMGVRPENFSMDSFRYMCILSGCDYLPSLPGIGLNKALKFINKTRDPDIHRALRRLPAYLNLTQIRVSDEYRDGFVHADATFRYQPVFDPRSRQVVSLTEPSAGEEPPDIAKEKLPAAVALDLALGNVDPFTLERVDNFDPDRLVQETTGIWKNQTFFCGHPSNFSGYHPETNENMFSGSLNCSSILEMTSHRALKRQATPSDAEAGNDIFPSDGDLLYMYKADPLPDPHSNGVSVNSDTENTHDVVNTSAVTPSRSEQRLDLDLETNNMDQRASLSPILSQHKSCNPFAKPMQMQLSGLGPPGIMGRPNYFSALRKFDGVYPMKIETDFTVVSRYFRSPGSADRKGCKETEESPDAHVRAQMVPAQREVSGNSRDSPAQNVFLDESILSQYSFKKEDMADMSSDFPASNVTTIENMQNQVISCHSITEREEEDEQKTLGVDKQLREKVKNPVPSFDWSQFTCQRSKFQPKFGSSEAVGRRFKNPFRKKVVLKCNGEELREKSDGVGDVVSFLNNAGGKADKDTTIIESLSSAADQSRKNVLGSSREGCMLYEDSVKPDMPHSFDSMKSKRSSILSNSTNNGTYPLEECLLEKVSVDPLMQQTEDDGDRLSGQSCDSGFYGSQEQSSEMGVAKGNSASRVSCPPPHFRNRSTVTSLRLGLSRSSTARTAPQKQNLLAQYGFLKKRKLSH